MERQSRVSGLLCEGKDVRVLHTSHYWRGNAIADGKDSLKSAGGCTDCVALLAAGRRGEGRRRRVHRRSSLFPLAPQERMVCVSQ